MSKIDDDDFSWGLVDSSTIDTGAIKAVTDMMKNGVMPLSTLPDPPVVIWTDAFIKDHIILAGNLLAINAITPKEWFKLTNLLNSKDEENINLAVEIIKIKTND